MQNTYKEIIDVINERKESLTRYRIINKIKFQLGEVNGKPEQLDFDDSSWKEVKLPFNWDNTKNAWFRLKITVPEYIDEVALRDSKLYLKGKTDWAPPVLNMPTKMYVDGKKTLEATNWFDLSYLNLIADKVVPGKDHIVSINTKGKEGTVKYYSGMPLISIFFSKIEDVQFEIEAFINEIKFAEILPKGEEELSKAFSNIDVQEIKKLKLKELIDLIHDLERKLSSLKSIAKKHKIYLVGYSHVDMNWLWPIEETYDLIKNTALSVDKVMEEHNDLCYSHSQAFTYKALEIRFPDIFKKIKKRVKEGRWELAATSWIEPDLNLLNGESIVNQILYAKKYIKEKFSYESKVFISADTFGHPWTIPQVLKKCGIDYYWFMRSTKKDYDIFLWQGIDGTKVFAFCSSLLGRVTTDVLVDVATFYYKSLNLKEFMYVYGIGDHGGGPTIEDGKLIKKLSKKPIYPELIFSTMEEAFSITRKQNVQFPLFNNEINFVFDGCYTTHWDMKVHNRQCERLLLGAQSLGSLVKIMGGKYPHLKEFWENTLFNQFHDILPGSGTKQTYELPNELAEKAEKGCQEEIFNCLDFISSKIAVKDEGKPIFVFNNLSWERTDVARIKAFKGCPNNIIIKDNSGNKYPAQVVDDEIIFIARNVPSLGYRVYYILEGEEETDDIIKDDLTLENDYFTLNINEKNGTVSHLYDKRNDREVIKDRWAEGGFPENTIPLKIMGLVSDDIPSTRVVRSNLLQVLYEEPHAMCAWVIGPVKKIENLTEKADIEIISRGPVVGKVRIKRKFHNSVIIQDILLYKNLDRIDFYTSIDWHEKSNPKTLAPMLKVSFTPLLKKSKATYEIPFGFVERNADGREVPALQWADLSDEEYGFSILTDTKYGFDAKGNTIRLTLIRTSYEPDPNPDSGQHSFIYSIYPHKGGWKEADTERRGYELNNKLFTRFIKKDQALLPIEKSFIRITSNNTIISCLKKAENNNDIVLRIYESKGQSSKATINLDFKIKKVVEVDLLENPIGKSEVFLKEGKIKFKIKPFEIKTIRLVL